MLARSIFFSNFKNDIHPAAGETLGGDGTVEGESTEAAGPSREIGERTETAHGQDDRFPN